MTAHNNAGASPSTFNNDLCDELMRVAHAMRHDAVETAIDERRTDLAAMRLDSNEVADRLAQALEPDYFEPEVLVALALFGEASRDFNVALSVAQAVARRALAVVMASSAPTTARH